MEKRKATKLSMSVIFLVSTLFLIHSVSAITANSSNYSVNLFGNGLATGTSSSENYNSTFLSEAKGTTRNAESSSYNVNVGFFEDTSYYRTVSITSYSISPSSAVVGSTISLYISALNEESVWAKITSPNSQQQTIILTNNEFITYSPPSIVGTYQVIFYANSSTGAIASVVDSFELTAQTTTSSSSSSSGGGGGTTTIIEKCTYLWDCTPWGVCADGKQKRICANTGTCNGIESKPIEEMQCSEALFDIGLKLKDIKLTENRTLKFNIDLTEKIGVEKIDVYIKYSIINKENYDIFSQIETKAIENSLFYEKEIEEIRLVDGEYTLRVEILYGYQQRAFAEQKLKIINGKIESIQFSPEIEKVSIFDNVKNILNKSYILIALIALIGTYYSLFIFRKNSYKKGYGGFMKSKIKYISIFTALLFFGIFVFMFGLIGNLNLTGKVIFDLASKENGLFVLFMFIIVILGWLIWKYKRKIKELTEKTGGRFTKKSPSNSIKGLINKKIYSSDGILVGEVNDVILGENKIDSLKIKLNKKKNGVKGIVIDYKSVKSVGQIVIIDKEVLEKIDFLKDNKGFVS